MCSRKGAVSIAVAGAVAVSDGRIKLAIKKLFRASLLLGPPAW
jgi:hypothetical protein